MAELKDPIVMASDGSLILSSELAAYEVQLQATKTVETPAPTPVEKPSVVPETPAPTPQSEK